MTPERLQQLRDCAKIQHVSNATVIQELLDEYDRVGDVCEKYAAELNRRRSTDSAVRQTLKECGAPNDHSIHSQIEFMADQLNNWRAYALALQELHDSGGAIMEPGLARQVDELREMCE